jgi:HAD superfamily hydrolase (TIGR01549 family)
VRAPPPPALVPERIRAIVFDLDGTLVDSYGAIALALNRARVHYDLPPLQEPEVRRAVGHGLDDLLARTLGPDRVEAGRRIFREEYARGLTIGTHALPGALPTVRELHGRGYRLGVASNKPSDFTERILDELALLPFLGAVLGPERAGAPKPDPAMIRACLRLLGVEAAEAVYAGDMPLDVESAARAGVAVVLVPGGSSDPAELRGTGQRVLTGLSELLEIFQGAG